jgi:hypothetical protein
MPSDFRRRILLGLQVISPPFSFLRTHVVKHKSDWISLSMSEIRGALYFLLTSPRTIAVAFCNKHGQFELDGQTGHHALRLKSQSSTALGSNQPPEQ